jgi:hypothetical protein
MKKLNKILGYWHVAVVVISIIKMIDHAQAQGRRRQHRC